MSIGRLIVLGIAALPIASAASCPYALGNEARNAGPPAMHPEALEPRFREDGPDFGRCSRKSKNAGGGPRNKDWWPCQLRLDVLRQHWDPSNPYGGDMDYATEFAKLDVDQLTKDLTDLQKNSQSWWPADFGDYGPFLIRGAWHSAGTYRSIDGRGGSGMGQQRFAPLNSWPDNASLDKARRILWPIKQKYGSKLSWADLITYAGNLALENMGFPTYGFAFGRVDTWQADDGIYWGSEREMFPGPKSDGDRYNGSVDIMGRANGLEPPLSDTNMGLIYVDPRGPHGTPDPKASARDIRMTFGRMGMNDEETVALIAGGHAFGKTHGAFAGKKVGPEPNAAGIELQGLGWRDSLKNNSAKDKYTSGIEVIWTDTPTQWSNTYLHSLFKHKWTLIQSPDGAPQWRADSANATYPDPFVAGKLHKPTMLTSDLALLHDPIYNNISKTFLNDFDYLTEKFGLAWYKLLHRDMGPKARYLGPLVPKKDPLIWQDPLPEVKYQAIDDADAKQLKESILAANGLNTSNLVTTAWGAASSFRIGDKRGGANGARIALEPQKSFAVNNPKRLATVLKALQGVKDKYNKDNKDKQVSLADLIVLGGNAAIEKAAKDAGTDITVPFTPGRVDATQDLTDIETFKYLEPQADGFRNYGQGTKRSLTEEVFVDKAASLTLTPPEMTVLVGGMRALDANFDGSKHGILTDRPGNLTNDFFVNLLSMSTSWSLIDGTNEQLFRGKDLQSDKQKYTATRADLVFGSHPELRAVSEAYAAGDAQDKFVKDFVNAWTKVMELDRYDIKGRKQNNVQ